ncbi:MAG: glycosyltransferase [Lachnospiraceae bacterium]|nr:glycosyltransferase [Lachnospiraceae bacterium]
MSKIIYIKTDAIELEDIKRVLVRMGNEVVVYPGKMNSVRVLPEEVKKLSEFIKEQGALFAISYDFIPSIAQSTMEAKIPYAAFVYDDPQVECYTMYAQYPNVYLFVFDRHEQKRLLNLGLKNVYYTVLGVDKDKEKYIPPDSDYTPCDCDVAFVGQLYNTSYMDKALNSMSDEMREKLLDTVDEKALKWEDGSFYGVFPDDICDHLAKYDGFEYKKKYPYIDRHLFFEAAVAARLVARKERLVVLNALSQKYKVCLYTFDKDTKDLCESVSIRPGAKYDRQVSKAYRAAKINLNIPLHTIEMGANQRVFDIMGAGGFVISSYNEELERLFVCDEEIVLFKDMNELEEKVSYYLNNKEARERIARQGRLRIEKEYNLQSILENIIEIVTTDIKNKDCEMTYDKLWKSDIERVILVKASSLMNEKMWLEAYKALREIPNPSLEAQNLVVSMERIINSL